MVNNNYIGIFPNAVSKEYCERVIRRFEFVKETKFGERGKIYSRQEIIDTSFGMDFDGFDRTIDTHIANLRKKLRIADNYDEYIESVYGLGYRLIDDE